MEGMGQLCGQSCFVVHRDSHESRRDRAPSGSSHARGLASLGWHGILAGRAGLFFYCSSSVASVGWGTADAINIIPGRFSINAILFVGLIGLTGFYSAYLRVGSWNELITSLFGHTLLVKQVFVAGLLAIAATNLLVISPQLKRVRLQGNTNTNVVARFRKLLVFELIFAGLLLASVSFLTYIPPAKLASTTSDLTASTRVDDLAMDISISPGRIGQNTFTLRISADGEPLRTANEVLLRFTSDQKNIASSDLELISQGDGAFTAKGTYLNVPAFPSLKFRSPGHTSISQESWFT